MKCRKCGSTNVTLNVVNEMRVEKVHHGCVWWLFVGWWWIPVKWICFTIPALFAKIFLPDKVYIRNRINTVAVCQNCGYTWKTR